MKISTFISSISALFCVASVQSLQCGGRRQYSLCNKNRNPANLNLNVDGYKIECPGSYTLICRYSFEPKGSVCLDKESEGWIFHRYRSSNSDCETVGAHIGSYSNSITANGAKLLNSDYFTCKVVGPKVEHACV